MMSFIQIYGKKYPKNVSLCMWKDNEWGGWQAERLMADCLNLQPGLGPAQFYFT